ncbi:MAG TPA: IS1595 family transposase [Terriglobales bacterium]|nr:IS1595 family transposase [Terriglobales bacterium]
MNVNSNKPKTLQDAILYFSDADNCLNYMVSKRWPDGVVTCPSCGRKDPVFLANQRKWQCKSVHPKRQFSAKVGTIFEDSPIGLDKWLTAMWMLANCKNGVSSYEISRTIGVTQKSAWFMMHRIRLAMKDRAWGIKTKLGGSGACEVDETFIGGKVRNMHKSRRAEIESKKSVGLKNETKTIVAGILDREKGQVRAQIIPNRERETLDSIVRNNVRFGSTIYSDAHDGYLGLRTRFTHEALNKSIEGYVFGQVHTQGIENFWSLLKRGLAGTYVAVEPCHLSRYLDEQVFRFNTRKVGQRKISDGERFELALSQVLGRRLTFAEVTGKVGETSN